MKNQFVIGIDLGTTNTVLAYLPLAGETPALEILPIPQIVAPGVVEARRELPSFLYLPLADEIAAAGSLLMGQSANALPVIILRGLQCPDETGKFNDLLTQ